MKKKLILAATLAATALLAAGCGSGGTYGKYVKLGDYKGVAVNKITSEVTDDAVDEEIQSSLEENATYTDVERGAKEGDQVNIDFVGKIDDVEFDGGSGEDYDLVLGSGDFVEGFEDQLIGAKAGEKLDVTVTFSDDYEEELAGKEAVFNVTVNKVQEVVVPELTEDYVKENTDFTSIDDYKASVKADLVASNEENNNYIASSDALSAVVSASTFNGYPQELYDSCKAENDENNQALADMFGIDVSEIAGDDDTVKEQIEEMVNQKMVISTIAEKEKITVSDDEYTQYLDDNYSDYGYESADEYAEAYGEDSIRDEILTSKVQQFILDNAKITEVTEDEYYGTDSESLLEDETFDEETDFETTEETVANEPAAE